jgi:uncharacterized repeat protein (TIGR01451 family)
MQEPVLGSYRRPAAVVMGHALALVCLLGAFSCAQYRHRCSTRPCPSCGATAVPDYFPATEPPVADRGAPPRFDRVAPSRRPAALSLALHCPSSARLDQEVRVTLEVVNTGEQDAADVSVRYVVPRGLRYLDATPPARAESDAQQQQVLVWEVGMLRGGQRQRLTAGFQTQARGRLLSHAEVTSAESLRADASAAIEVSDAQLRVEIQGPQQAVVGQSVTFDITVINAGEAPATNLEIVDTYDDGFVYDFTPKPGAAPVPSTEPIRLFKQRVPELARLDPGQRQTYPLTLRGTRAGMLRNQVTVTAEGGLQASAEATVEFRRASLSVRTTGPKWRFQGGRAEFNISVTNTGDSVLREVLVTDYLPPETSYSSASRGGMLRGDTVEWQLGDLEPGRSIFLLLELRAEQLAPQTINRVVVTSEDGVQSQAEAALEIRAKPPGLDTYMFDLEDLVSVGEEVTYEIRVENHGGEIARGVQIQALSPPQLMLIEDAHVAPAGIGVDQQGNRLKFGPADLAPGQSWVFHVRARAVEPHPDARFRVEFRWGGQLNPIIEEEPTTIIPREP